MDMDSAYDRGGDGCGYDRVSWRNWSSGPYRGGRSSWIWRGCLIPFDGNRRRDGGHQGSAAGWWAGRPVFQLGWQKRRASERASEWRTLARTGCSSSLRCDLVEENKSTAQEATQHSFVPKHSPG
eukprot:3775161-Rhodomonas_salina.2